MAGEDGEREGVDKVTFSTVAIVLAFVLYVIIGIGNIRAKDYPHAVVWFCYAGSQLGFLWYELVRDSK